ncbi:MAG: sensor histidine kinase [Planctomycetota bacterium]|nr:MAG: sensor histidine kinase [Planctomycetota bacterium]
MRDSRRHLIDTLFSDRRRRVICDAGSILMRQGERNTRLYMVIHGSLTGMREVEDGEPIPVLSFNTGELVGIQSIFLNDFVATLTISAERRSELAWIDLVHDRPDDLERRVIPLLVRALLKRQEQALHQAQRERNEALRDKELEQMGFLGQMAAAVAHELNNALAVVARGGEWLGGEVEHLARYRPPLEAAAFHHGWHHGRPLLNSDAVRKSSAEWRKRGFDFAASRRIAQMDPDSTFKEELLRATTEQIPEAIRSWELGATLRDMAISSRQAAHVVTALKQLGASDRLRREQQALDDSIKAAITILGNKLRTVDVHTDFACSALMSANQGELVQIWSNLISNACEAMASTQRSPHLVISTCHDDHWAYISIGDNGPGIPDSIRKHIFEPNVTTKKAGLSFGLGLGLAVVRRLVTLYGGSITVHSSSEGTTFKVTLPLIPSDDNSSAE